MFHPSSHFHERPIHAPPSNSLRASDYPCDPTDSCCVAPSSSSDDDNDDHGLEEDQLEDPFVSSASWDEYQISESIRKNVLPLFRTSPLSSSSSLDSSSSSDCSTSLLKPPPSILRFEHYSSSATKFLFDVDGDDEEEEDDMDDDQVEEEESHSSGNWIQEQLQVPLLHHEHQHKQQFMVDDDCRKNEASRDILWSPPLPLRSRSFASQTRLARDELNCQHVFPALGIQPMSSCSESHCDFDRKAKSATKTPSTASSVTTATPNPKRLALEISLRPMAIWVPTVMNAPPHLSLHHQVVDAGDASDDDDDDDVSTLTLDDEQYQQPPWLPKTVKGSYDVVESDLLLLLEKERSDWRRRQQQQRQRYDAPRKPNHNASPTTTMRDVWTNHDLDWLTDEEDSLSTLTAALSNSCSSWYDDGDDEEDEC